MVTQQAGSQFTTPAPNIINGQNPAEKSALLQGQVDISQPILYYDLEKELAFVFLPNGLQMTNAEQEKVIGQLTNKLVDTLPAEQKKFYLLNPKPFLSIDSLIKAILQADGITEEDLKAQEARVKLLEEFLQTSDEAILKEKIEENEDKLDRGFFEVVTATMQAAQLQGNQAGAQALFALRSFIARHSPTGKQAVKEIDEELGLVYVQTQEELLEKLRNAESDEAFEALAAAGHQFLDYNFFQKLTAQIDAAAQAGEKEKEQTLKKLRSRILETRGRQEEQSRAALQKAADLLKEVLQSGQPAKVLEKNLDKIDDAFFAILSANIQEARRQKQEEAAKAMEMVGNMTMSLLQARQPSQAEADQANPSSEIHIAR